MKKKKSMYMSGGPYSYGKEVSNGFSLKGTQDSKKDDIPSQKANNFLNWIKETAMKANMRDMDNSSQGMKSFGGSHIQDSYNHGVIAKPGNSQYDYGMKADPYLQSHIQAFENSELDWSTAFQNLGFARNGGQPHYGYAQQGYQIPALNIWDPNYYNQGYGQDPTLPTGEVNDAMQNMHTTHGYMDFLENLNSNLDQKVTEAKENNMSFTDKSFNKSDNDGKDSNQVQQEIINNRTLNEQGDMTADEMAAMNDKSPNMFEQFNTDNPYVATNAAIGGLQLLGNIANMDERRAREKHLRERMSNVHRLFAERGQDRGDYMVNTPGVGDPLKPDEHVRFGYNTKMAQDGLEVGSELALTEAEIKELIKQGYDIEYI